MRIDIVLQIAKFRTILFDYVLIYGLHNLVCNLQI